MKWLRVLLVLILLVLLALGVGFLEAKRRLAQPLNIPEAGFRLNVGAGDSAAALTRRLARDGVLADPQLLRWYARLRGDDARIKRGEYQLHPGLDSYSLLALLISGDVIHYQVTLPEGLNLREALLRLQSNDNLQQTLTGVNDPALRALAADRTSLEGLFFPDTYRFEAGASDLDILTRAFHRMAKVLEQEWPQRDVGLPYESPHEALIMASVVEKETGVPQERGQIAGVFVRRLQQRMRLQTDPTVIYGLGEGFDGNLRRKHLKDQNNPYNTYRHHGLPPTPIALPGLAAIRAALHPEPGTALYFVARGDGTHEFSDTLQAHEAAVKRYQKTRRKDYRSSPVVPR